MVDCVTDAKPNTPFITGALSRSIRFNPAKAEGNTVVGVWGSFDINYALAVETGNASLAGPNLLAAKTIVAPVSGATSTRALTTAKQLPPWGRR